MTLRIQIGCIFEAIRWSIGSGWKKIANLAKNGQKLAKKWLKMGKLAMRGIQNWQMFAK
jgi:hypothetical protein